MLTQEEAKQAEIERIRREQEEKKRREDEAALEKSKESKTGVEWQLEEDHCLSQAVKKFPVGSGFWVDDRRDIAIGGSTSRSMWESTVGAIECERERSAARESRR